MLKVTPCCTWKEMNRKGAPGHFQEHLCLQSKTNFNLHLRNVLNKLWLSTELRTHKVELKIWKLLKQIFIKILWIWIVLFGFFLMPKRINSLVFDLGSLGPSTVTLIAFVYVATWGGELLIVMVSVKLFPKIKTKTSVKTFTILWLNLNLVWFTESQISKVFNRF